MEDQNYTWIKEALNNVTAKIDALDDKIQDNLRYMRDNVTRVESNFNNYVKDHTGDPIASVHARISESLSNLKLEMSKHTIYLGIFISVVGSVVTGVIAWVLRKL